MQFENKFISKLMQSDSVLPQFSQSDMMSAQLIQSEEVQPQPAQPDMMTAEKIPRLNEKLTHSVVMPEKQPDKQNSEHGQAQTPQADQLSSAEDSQTKISHSVICQAQPKLEQCEKQLNQSLKHDIHRFMGHLLENNI